MPARSAFLASERIEARMEAFQSKVYEAGEEAASQKRFTQKPDIFW